ncbi:histidine kinase [Desulfobacter hydrogenophilus]|uniref:histidine kinase n=1 Tax=Desulfobacter hydrogenophilus TaxID=2291 RepID=A0A328FD64_9BACT|nr:ATP-binding protein [Desulfobacter hydrogenophilus]NDY71534.1 GAF domain-containing protein [Desulfobacter hydrogenophilus]QBH11918.1 GAF domain-containing protein [Desulfobacter hydrogenophilus]RAM02591.1 histidine kinase [Desulfobacter hydrogenophilus]
METAKEKELYSDKILDAYVALIQEKYPEIEIEDLMDEAGIENYSKTGDNAIGLSQAHLNRFHQRLCILTDNMEIAREAGRYAVKPQCLGWIRSLLLPFVRVRRACVMMGNYAGGLTPFSRYTTRYIGKNKIEIVVIPNEGTKEEPFQCEIRQGYFQGLADVFLHNDLTVHHPECMFKGGKVCRYELVWRDSVFPLLVVLSWLAGAAAIVISIALWITPFAVVPKSLWLMCPAFLFLGLGWAAQMVKSKALARSLRGIHNDREEILNQFGVNAENSKVIVEIGQVLGIEDPDACSFERAANIVGKNLRYDRVMIMIADDEKTSLSYRGGYGFTEIEKVHIANYSISLEGASEGVFYESFRYNKPMLVNDIAWLKRKYPQSRELTDRIKPRSFIISPIEVDGAPIGIMIAGNTVTLRKLDSNDIHLVMGVAQQISGVYRRQKCEKQQGEFKRQIVQLQKMEALGVLAGGIAHDFNNILSPILGYTDLCLSMCPEDEKMLKYLRRVKNASIRAQDLVAQILAFSRQGEKEYIRCHPGPIIKESLKLLRASVPKNIKIETFIRTDLAPVMADPTQIHQIVMNLCTNAHHAMMDNGGLLTVRLDEIQVQESPLEETRRILPGTYIHLQVLDTGHGMSRAVMDNIFEPYFTTKRKGRGTGMGLPIIKGIVARLKGYIFVDSTEGEGSCFDIYLPQAAENKFIR